MFNYVESYKDFISFDIRKALRHVTVSSLYTSYKFRNLLTEGLHRNRIQLLYFHHIFKDEEVNFRRMLEVLSINHKFITHTEAINRILTNDIDKPYVSISFDDGFKNCIQAAEIMNSFGAKGCFFINPRYIENKNIEQLSEFYKKINSPPVELMNWNDIEYLIKNGHELGGHTLSHVNLASTEGDRLYHEIHQGKQMLTDKFGKKKIKR